MSDPSPALPQDPAELAPPRVGVMIPTYNRPDLLRSCVLQLAIQSRPPDIICVHQNGHPDSYQWAIDDLQVAPQLVSLHTPEKIAQHQWYGYSAGPPAGPGLHAFLLGRSRRPVSEHAYRRRTRGSGVL